MRLELPQIPDDLVFVDRAVERLGRSPDSLIPILQAIQEHYRYLPRTALERVCQISDITPAALEGVSTFYAQFRHNPVGKHIIRVCHGTACHVKNSDLVHDAVRRKLNLKPGQETDDDKLFTIERVGCLGCCTLAPVLQIDGVTYGHGAPDTAPQSITDFLERSVSSASNGHFPTSQLDGKVSEIRVGVGSCCIAGGSMRVRQELESAVARTGANAIVKPVGCVGMCHQTPLVEVAKPGRPSVMYTKVSEKEAEWIVRRHFKPRGLVRRAREKLLSAIDWLYTDESWESSAKPSTEIREGPVCDFLDRQKRIATENCGTLGPLDLDEYLAHEGFVAARKVLNENNPAGIIDQIKKSGLRGRGGAGFPTGNKWDRVRAATGNIKYLISNGDEGDPGAFMDRMILESYPYRELEGMIIAAFAIGAHEGYLYIRHEYPLAVERIKKAIDRCTERGLLGDNILGSGFSLHLKVMEGAGAFVCGEETALLASMEGRRGMPRLRPPFPADKGLWEKPTCINNVETYALVPWIIRNGCEAFASLGTAKSKGTKVFALTGKIARGGLIEVPMGVTIRQIVQDIGGGIAGGKKFKAAQIGGPSGGCIPAELADTPIDYESLNAAGAIMGSGGLVIMDEDDCMVDIARYFLSFTQAESCGKCTFCRVGTKQMLDILNRLCDGKAKKGDLEKLEELAGAVKKSSLCGLGQTAPNPVLTSLRYFRHEYEAHLNGHCPAGKCKPLIKYSVNDDCIGCTKCAQVCPDGAIEMKPYARHEIQTGKCTRCDICRLICPTKAIEVH